MMRVVVNYSPRLTKAEQEIIKMPNRLKDLRPLMKQSIVPRLDRMLKRHWDSKGAAFGHKWVAWSDVTRRKRVAKGNAAKGILRDTDHLFKAVFRQRKTDDRLRVVAGGIRFQANVAVKYALAHQKGVPERNLPVRQVIPDPLPRSFTQEVRAIVREYILTGKTAIA